MNFLKEKKVAMKKSAIKNSLDISSNGINEALRHLKKQKKVMTTITIWVNPTWKKTHIRKVYWGLP